MFFLKSGFFFWAFVQHIPVKPETGIYFFGKAA